jgi:PAS domain S-box-containing protein
LSTVQTTAFLRAEFADPQALEAFADALEVGCVSTDGAFIIRSWNRWMEAATGRTANDAIGKPLVDLFPAIKGTAAEHAFTRALSGEAVMFSHSFHEYLLPMPPRMGPGTFEFMQQSARILPLVQDGHTTGAIALIQDVSERIEREQELYHAKQTAETANQTKSDFLTAMSHEFRTPLNAILGYSSILETEISGPLNASQKEHLHRIEAGTRHLITLIEEILTFSSIEAQKVEAELEATDITEVAREVVSLLENQANEAGIALVADLDYDRVVVTTDVRRFKQILVNVVGNAIKFTERGSVTISMDLTDDKVLLRVTDTGSGISPEHVQQIFEPFVRAERHSSARRTGTGLGLPLSRSLAQLIGGTLKLEATGPAGSTFLLEIPRT